ncbi:uncharacterized protein LOC119660089 [Hermetia illucens]|nr:uncharacterized protein LOC119660089 [Hermetia illucens]
MVSIEDLEADIRKLWEQEELPQDRILTLKEADCERQFIRTTKRDLKSGRYIVRLPIKPDMNPSILLHPSLKDAVIRLRQTETKLERNPELKAQYNAFLKEYLELGHMSEVPSAEIFSKHSYYLPHHAEVREDSTTTKVRVIFNASHKTSSGTSLNDILMVGPNTQYTIFEILLRWRRHKYALAADIEKMYRQILVDSRDCDLLRIVWRPEPQGPIKHYRLNTVTYGTVSVPFQATRTLQQVAEDEQFTSPSASESIKKDFYVDDLLTGSSTIEGAAKLQNDIVNVLKKAGFNIRKWSTNYEEVLKHVSTADQETSDVININLENTVKTLGLQWIPKDDIFTFKVKLPHISANEPVTKRIITSNAARLFDPLGWIQPIIIVSKVFIQRLWLQKLDWDKPVPDQLKIEWLTYMKEWPALSQLQIPRYIQTSDRCKVELHGFCDASMAAFAAVIYVRVIYPDGTVSANILTSKSKVVPLKLQSVPRLELNGAVLLCRLMKHVKQACEFPTDTAEFYWTDSTIVLAWLSDHPARWKTFVANRVSEIQAKSNSSQWRHVDTEWNPVDIASRGVTASQLLKSDLCWNGPEWLQHKPINYLSRAINITTTLERKPETACKVAKVAKFTFDNSILGRYSDFAKLTRIVAYCLRFKSPTIAKPATLTTSELNNAEMACVRLSQALSFKDEIERLDKGQPVPATSKLFQLTPFTDAEGILRVDGRLRHSLLSDDRKHPVILSPDCKLSELIVRAYHLRTLHGDNQVTQAAIRRQYWILQCITCFKSNAKPGEQLMGALPETRVTPGGAFKTCGLDFAGPIQLK